jgi:hypothetical protein
MGFILIGLFVFFAAYAFCEFFNFTKKIYTNLHSLIADMQMEQYRSFSKKPHIALMQNIASVLFGLLGALAVVFICGWLVTKYMDDGFFKSIILFSLIVGTVLMPVSFGIQARITIDTWFKFTQENNGK